jgi:hypothetical protein
MYLEFYFGSIAEEGEYSPMFPKAFSRMEICMRMSEATSDNEVVVMISYVAGRNPP